MNTQPENAPSWATAVGSIVAAFAMIIIGSSLISLIFGNTPSAVITGWTIGALMMVVFVSMTRSREWESLRLQPPKTPLPLIVLMGVAFALALDLISLVVTQAALPPVELLSFFNPATLLGGEKQVVAGVTLISWILAFLFMAGAQPVGEELIFRGIVFPAFRHGMQARAAVFLSALAYALFHLLAYAPPAGSSPILLWYSFGVPFFEGVFISGVRAYTGSTRAAIAAHFAIGALAALRALVLIG